ncbi:MAG: leucine-rich repeat domain-containing protein [Promethearchaeota archaeon]
MNYPQKKELAHLTDLQELDLGDNQIKELRGLEKLTKLKILDLSWNPIKGIKELRIPCSR